ncbi:hypothetical protein Gohar_026749 [Gossypium harknessii]|uniref:Uncharacterized protein n=1 Tax=Gossypium harknessii TaxID=34285 RepID=A0A7J9HT16_9ROSI|nr:hypothetical protein [Gossypium harknessii]
MILELDRLRMIEIKNSFNY